MLGLFGLGKRSFCIKPDDYSFCWFREASRKSLNSADCCVESIEVTEILEGEVPTRNLAFPVLTKTSLCRESI